MSRAELRRFLTDVALDPALRALAESDAVAASAAYALADEDRAALRSSDGRTLSLLARALAPEPECATESAAPPRPAEAPPPATPVVVPLPEIPFAVRVRPHAVAAPGGGWQITCNVSVEPMQGAAPRSAETAPPASPWAHRIDSPEAREAARAVRDARPEERRARLADLASALRGDGPAR